MYHWLRCRIFFRRVAESAHLIKEPGLFISPITPTKVCVASMDGGVYARIDGETLSQTIPSSGHNPFITFQHLPSGTVFIIVGAILGGILLMVVVYYVVCWVYYNRRAKQDVEKYIGYQSDSDVMLVGQPSFNTMGGRLYRDLVLQRGLMYISPTLLLKLKGNELMVDITGSTINDSTANELSMDASTMYRDGLLLRPSLVMLNGDVLASYNRPRGPGSLFRQPSLEWLEGVLYESGVEGGRYSSQFLDDIYLPEKKRRSSQGMNDLLVGKPSRPPSMVLDELLGDDEDDGKELNPDS